MKLGSISSSAGSGASVSLIGVDACGSTALTTGTGSSTGVEFTLMFDQSTSSGLIGTNPTGMQHQIELFSANANAQGVVFYPYLSLGLNNVVLGFGVSIGGTIADNTTYEFAYRIK